MANPTKVVRFPNRSKLHLVWSSTSSGDSDQKAQKPGHAFRQPGEVPISMQRELDGGSSPPEKTE